MANDWRDIQKAINAKAARSPTGSLFGMTPADKLQAIAKASNGRVVLIGFGKGKQ